MTEKYTGSCPRMSCFLTYPHTHEALTTDVVTSDLHAQCRQRVFDLEASMLNHFTHEHMEGDGPEIDRWKRRVTDLEAALQHQLAIARGTVAQRGTVEDQTRREGHMRRRQRTQRLRLLVRLGRRGKTTWETIVAPRPSRKPRPSR